MNNWFQFKSIREYFTLPRDELKREIEAHKKADEALKESEAKYRLLFASLPYGCAYHEIIVDENNKPINYIFLEVNDVFKKLSGLKRDEIIGKKVTDVLPGIENDPVDWIGKYGEVAQTGRGIKFENHSKFIKKWFSVTAFSPKKGCFIVILDDISDRKKVENELKSISSIPSENPNPVVRMDKEYKVIYRNAAFDKLLKETGLAEEDSLEILPDNIKTFIDQGLKTKKPIQFKESTLGDKVISYNIIPIAEEGYVNLYGRDITKTKIADKALRKSEEFMRNVLETVKDGFIVVDKEYRILSANRAFFEQVKMSAADVIGEYCYKISHHIDKPCHLSGKDCSVQRAFETGKPYMVIHTHFDKYGKPIYIETNSYPLKNLSGEFDNVIETTRDITEKVKLEKQLLHSQKMDAVGQLAGGVAHDFNNILSAIISYGHILNMKIKDEEQAHNVRQILAAAERAATLTSSLLAFGKKQILSTQPVKLNTIINDVEKLILGLIDKNIDLKIKLAENASTVMVDSGQIAQVLINLATNARDAMPEGGTLTIETGIIELDDSFIIEHGYGDSGKYAFLFVSDTGAGMDEITIEKIFEPFFTTKESGTGLGMAIIYGIIKQHRGYITVESIVGEGTVFKCYLPLSSEEVG